ncbi:hypothetical protein TNCV_3071141 [Trichonephila clavipes]|nr:hypothetical protein TNCV_3071141 [Trichonephila clavipes]
MGDCTYAGKSDMHYILSRANCTSRDAPRMYPAQFPDLFQQLRREAVSFHVTSQATGQLRTVQSPRLEESILNAVADISESRTRTVALHASVSHHTICRVLNEIYLHSFLFQRVQALNPSDYPFHLNFCLWVLYTSVKNLSNRWVYCHNFTKKHLKDMIFRNVGEYYVRKGGRKHRL